MSIHFKSILPSYHELKGFLSPFNVLFDVRIWSVHLKNTGKRSQDESEYRYIDYFPVHPEITY